MGLDKALEELFFFGVLLAGVGLGTVFAIAWVGDKISTWWKKK